MDDTTEQNTLDFVGGWNELKRSKRGPGRHKPLLTRTHKAIAAAELAAGCGPRWDYLARPATRSAARDPLRPVARSALQGSRCRRRPCVPISEVLVL